jgi:hypothetical protein
MVAKSTALNADADSAPTPRERKLEAELTDARKQIVLLTNKIVAMGKELDGLKKRLSRSPLTNMTRSVP